MYKSTRSENELINASKAIINGIAKEGGLYVPVEVSNVDLIKIINYDFYELANYILGLYLDDFPKDIIKDIVYKAYKNKFDIDGIVKIKECSKAFFLELHHGPTLAFKDVALSILPLLLEESKKINSIKERTIILTATSGDTGSAALCGFCNQKDVDIIVFYPTIGVSKIQEQQMLSYSNENTKVIAIEGNFDDAQSLVKKAFNDPSFSKYNLSSANSINIGRLLPQIIYYFYSYIDLINKGKIIQNEEVNIVVPTGNFGNIMAAFYAKKMGLPVHKLICASNTNKVLTDFFNNNKYDKNRKLIKTSSPSMDILVSSNLERLLYYVCDENKEESPLKVTTLMKQLSSTGHYEIDELVQSDKVKDILKMFYANYSTERETIDTIKEVYENEKYLIDTHTAVGYSVYKKYLNETNDKHQTIIASTASPFKFPKSIAIALDIKDDIDEFKLIEEIERKTSIVAPTILSKLNKDYKKEVWNLLDSYSNLGNLLGEIYAKNKN